MRRYWFCLLLLLSNLAQAQLSEPTFNRPDATYAPGVDWLWVNGFVDKEGINLDLEALAATRIGGGTLFNLSQGKSSGPLRFNSSAWSELLVHALQQADRLGLKFNLYAAAGNSNIGGVWITPENASQQLVWTEAVLKGVDNQIVQLPTPKSNHGYLKEVAVLACPDQKTIDPSKIIDLTAQVDSEGKLNWTVPKGDWVVVRFGSTVTDRDYGGLDADLLSRKGVQQHYDAFLKPLLEQTTAFHGRSLLGLSMNVQLGSLNWTSLMMTEFLKQTGYDLKPFLLAFTGRNVLSELETERFRWDFQRVQSEMMEEYAVGGMQDLLKRHGLALHVSRQPKEDAWSLQKDFSALKQKMDSNFTERTPSPIHLAFEHLPLSLPENIGTGNSTNYSRNYCLFNKLTDCFEYATRCNYLFQNSLTVADGAFFPGEGVPCVQPDIPGYAIDALTRDELLKQSTVSNKWLQLADGRSYRFLALPAVKSLSLPLLRKLKALLEDGLWLSAQKPTTWTGRLSAKEQEEWNRTVNELWSKLPDGVYRYGAGRLFINIPIERLLAEIKLGPDFVFAASNSDVQIRYRHRRSGSDDVWFIANTSNRIDTLLLGFRITGRQPEWWNPLTGNIQNLDIFRQQDDKTMIPFILQPNESGFVVFRKRIDKTVYDGLTKDGFLVFGANPDVFPEHLSIGILSEKADSVSANASIPAWQSLDGKLLFRTKGRYALLNPNDTRKRPSGLELNKNLYIIDLSTNWTLRAADGMEQSNRDSVGFVPFPGTAIWRKEFLMNPKDLLGYELILDLGTVSGVAEIYLNGKSVGLCWKKPYRLDVTNLLRLGENQLEIQLLGCPNSENVLHGPINLSAWKELKK